MTDIVPLTFRDLESFLDSCEDYHKESCFNDMSFSRQQMQLSAMNAMAVDEEHISIAKDGDRVIGFIFDRMLLPEWSRQLYAQNMYIYVDPKYRGTIIAKKLLKAGKDWADKMCACKYQVGVISGINTERTSGWFKKLGFSPLGAQFIINL